MLRAELASTSAALNLHERLAARGRPICFPEPSPRAPRLSCRELYDVCLALTLGDPVSRQRRRRRRTARS